MKNFTVVLIACFAVFQLATADNKIAKECLVENGFQESDLGLLNTIGKQGFVDVIKDVDKEKYACTLACVFKKENPGENLHDVIKNTISKDTYKTENLRKEMLDTLSTCKTQAADDDCKLLQCLKVTELPFLDTLYALTLERGIRTCFTDNGLQVADIQYMRQSDSADSLKEALEKIDEGKLSCAMACTYSLKSPVTIDKNLKSILETRINESDKTAVEQKNQMLETLNKCATEAGEDNCKLVKCVKILRSPFVDLYLKT